MINNCYFIQFVNTIFVTVLTPLAANSLERRGLFKRYPWSNAPIQLLLCGFFLTLATPMACALFSQRAQISIDKLEPEIQVRNLCCIIVVYR